MSIPGRCFGETGFIDDPNPSLISEGSRRKVGLSCLMATVAHASGAPTRANVQTDVPHFRDDRLRPVDSDGKPLY